MRDSRANAKADQWMNGLRWRSKIAKSDHVIAIAAGRSPSGVENAYAVAVASKKNLITGHDKWVCWRAHNKNVQPEEHEDFRPNAGRVIPSIRAKSLEGSEYNENSCPTVIEREREVDKELVREICGNVRFLDDVVDVLYLYCQRWHGVDRCYRCHARSQRS